MTEAERLQIQLLEQRVAELEKKLAVLERLHRPLQEAEQVLMNGILQSTAKVNDSVRHWATPSQTGYEAFQTTLRRDRDMLPKAESWRTPIHDPNGGR